MPAPNRFAAIDTDVLLALTAGDEECQEAIDGLSRAGFYCIVTETQLQELADICHHEGDQSIQTHAGKTLQGITNFGFITPSLTSVQMGVAERVAQKLVEFMKSEEVNDGLVVAEAAYNGCRILITRRKCLLDCVTETLRLALVDHDLSSVVIASPSELVEYFRASKA